MKYKVGQILKETVEDRCIHLCKLTKVDKTMLEGTYLYIWEGDIQNWGLQRFYVTDWKEAVLTPGHEWSFWYSQINHEVY